MAQNTHNPARIAQMLSSRTEWVNLALTHSGWLDMMRPVQTIPL